MRATHSALGTGCQRRQRRKALRGSRSTPGPPRLAFPPSVELPRRDKTESKSHFLLYEPRHGFSILFLMTVIRSADGAIGAAPACTGAPRRCRGAADSC